MSSSPLEASAAQSRFGRSYTTMVIATGAVPVRCARAASRWPASVRVMPLPPDTAAIRSSQTAVELLATDRIFAPSVPPTVAAEEVTCADQSGFTYI
jgi:hypothetical protein